ncbi:MAG: hypothetical protein AB8G14_05565 [Ilumatobacter sp.]
MSWAQQIDENDGQGTLVTRGHLVSDTGARVGSRVQLHAPLGTHPLCFSMWPKHEANPATGGYTLLYTYVYATTSQVGPCGGLEPSKSRSVVASLGGDLSRGTSVDILGGDPGNKDNDLAVTPDTGAVLVVERMAGASGRATLFSPTLQQVASLTFTNEDRLNDNQIIDPVAASDPLTGNWLVVWGVGGATMVLDASGAEIVSPARRLGFRLLEVEAGPDGSFWGVNSGGGLVHISAGGEQLSTTTVGRDGGHPGLAIGASSFGTRGLAFGASGSFSAPAVVPFSVPGPAATALAPARLLETRRDADGATDGLSDGIGTRRAGQVLTLQVGGRGGVPADAGAALVNITAVRPSSRGFVTAFPCDAPQPTSSNLNFLPGGATSSAAFVTLDDAGAVCLFTSSDVELVLDVNGFVPGSASLSPIVPGRLLDTRGGDTVDGLGNDSGRVGAGQFAEVQVRGRAGIPDDADSAIVNVTVINPSQNTFVTAYACDEERPDASNLNVPAGRNVTNLVLADLSASGTMCVFTNRSADLVVDVSAFVPRRGDLSAVLPARLLETRTNANGTIDGRNVGAGPIAVGVTELDVAGRGPVPDDATGVMLNVGAIRPDNRGFMTLYSCDVDRPDASNVNLGPGAVVSNAVFVALSGDGKVCLASSARTDVIVDVVGYTSAA